MEGEIYCHGNLKNEALGVSDSCHQSPPALRAFLCDHPNDTHAAAWEFATTLGLMDFALGMAKPPAAQNGSLFSSTNVLRCLSDLSEPTKADDKNGFKCLLKTFSLPESGNTRGHQNLKNLSCLSTAFPLD